MRGVAGGGDSSFGDGLAAAARLIIADGRRALTDPELSEPEAVHEVRKALKRWRALLRLLARPLGEQANQLRTEARELMRAVAGARDAQSALDALADLRKTDQPFSATSIESIRARLTEMRDAAGARSFTRSTRERISRYLDYATLSLERWPLKAIDFDTVTDGLTSTYRRARQLVPDRWADSEAEHLHDLRRRVVEHRHQMDLVEPLWPRLGKVWAEEAQRLRNQLGSCQDLAVLTNFTAPHQPLAPWRSRLAPLVEARRNAHLKSAARIAGRLFAEKPKAFRRRMTALWSARNSRTQ
ncbi:MAG TPA: CHAD domain-containing protein [Pseudolabrys sp.]|jgi:CHAD domain-containing protein|nr:CHAD domain-containing protein [Pseudolabrys sp.]